MNNFIHQFNIDPKICNKLIEYHKHNIEYKFEGVNSNKVVDKDIKDSIDVSVFPSSNHPDVESYFLELKKGLDSFFKANSFPEPNNIRLSLFTQEGFNIQYYPAGGGFKDWHFERADIKGHMITRTLVFMTYLNDVSDGGTVFKYQKITAPAKKGLTLIWPSDWTHLHKGQISKTETKYILTGWLNYRG